MPKPRAGKKRATGQVRKVALPVAGVVEVAIPKGTVPIVATDPDKGIVSIIQVPKEELKEQTWLEWLFGSQRR